MIEVVRSMPWRSGDPTEPLLTREWLVTNALGGYASGTVGGVATRRYHGYLIAALPTPHGRTMVLSQLSEVVRLPDGQLIRLGGEERVGGRLEVHAKQHLREFRLEQGLPVWRFELGHGFVLEKRVLLVHRQNTVHVSYALVEGKGAVRLKLQPSMHFRSHDAEVSTPLNGPYKLTALEGRYEIYGPREFPPLRMAMKGLRCALTIEPKVVDKLLFRLEEDRGYERHGQTWSPGYFRTDLHRGDCATLIASSEEWPAIDALEPAYALNAERARRTRLIATSGAEDSVAKELVLAADQFIVTPLGRALDAARARAAGDEVRSVIAGYHWFTDWGRDTMISLDGLTLATGRHMEAGYILRTFAHYVRDGLIPNLFPEGANDGLYHTADATLWFFHALHRYLTVTGDRTTLRQLLPTLQDIARKHLAGTKYGIHVDPEDGLLVQGAEGYQLTWMDAKYKDWVVTPRRGKAVEINALWYNALRLLEQWSREEGDAQAAGALGEHAARARAAFNRRFWYEKGGYLYDVVDPLDGAPDDAACRPNQLFAVSLDHPVLDQGRWAQVVETVRAKLLTPVGLRSLAQDHPDYKPNYHGDLRNRDAAYHQGTVWSWLIGPFIDAWIRVHPEDRRGARKMLDGLAAHLGEACLGSISEVFDAEAPYTARGCIAQAWGVAETLRAWKLTGE